MKVFAVYDRNLSDVQEAKEYQRKIINTGFSSLTEQEKQKWYAGLKGYLNTTDLNRIEGNCKELGELLNIQLGAVKTWGMQNIPTQSDFQRIRDNVEKIRESRYVYPSTPYTPELPLNTYNKINDIEKILYDVHTSASGNFEAKYYIDEIYINEEMGEI